MSEVVIGMWIESEAREISHCPSYYAADHETLAIKPGYYPARLIFQGGYNIPMPYWLMVTLESERIEGRLYSGFGGNNFASTELPKGEAVRHSLQMYQYQIREYVAAGKLILSSGFEWLNAPEGEYSWQRPGAPKEWSEVAKMPKWKPL